MIRRLLFSCCFVPALAIAQYSTLQFGPKGATYTQVLVVPPGSRLLIGTEQVSNSANPSVHTHIALANVDASPVIPILAPGGNGNDAPRAAAVDASGNIWIVGETDSDDFPVTNAIVAQKVPYRTAGFVMELDSTGSKVLFATYLAGQSKLSVSGMLASRATAIAIDGGGNVYVGGQTDESDFPTTAGAFAAGKPGADNFTNTYFYSFLVKISPAGKLVYSALVDTGKSACVGGSSCIPQESTFATAAGVAVDASGVATMAGIQGGAANKNNAYVARVAADGSKLVWSATPPMTLGDGNVLSLFMGQDAAGNVDVFGEYQTLLQALPVTFAAPGLFAMQVKADGSGVNWSLDLGRAEDASAQGVTVDSRGVAWLAGTSASPQFPALNAGLPSLGPDFVLRLDSAGAVQQPIFRLPRGTVTAPPVLSPSQALVLLGARGALVTFPPGYALDTPAVVGFANAASFDANTGIYAGALLTIFGFGLPSQVTFNGNPAAVLYAGANQLNVQVPFQNIQGTVSLNGATGSLTFLPPFEQSLGLFTADGVSAAALNQDGSVNAFVNPAVAGSVVTLFGTGATWPAGMQLGATATGAMPLDQGTNQFEVVDATGTPQNILYAGAAPGLIDGVFQINVQLTPGVLPPLKLLSHNAPAQGTLTSNAVLIYVRQP